ncbi:alkaline phosphatase family protein [Lentisphaera profundi]|uniref:Alkaline phosphatase family protein n=1 Tax=Lentisphaera profundi TaxID=1658616 RepID=A0ABY7VWF4_9BACT|nr:alkaline phosphatase family protein [Lentisphaera profundi]WDE98553.1 alkaline phosphatase family protein [Lentisphaera profundi]
MKKEKLALFLFIDAFGWEILKKHSFFLADKLKSKQKLETVFGYSSACDPSIISGRSPSEHGHWNSFYYAPKTCPYKWLKYLRFMPEKIMNHHRVRSKLSSWIKKIHGFTGYFMLYNVPFKYLPLFDYAEKNRIWEPGGLNQGENIFDQLSKNNLSFHTHHYGQSDEVKISKLEEKIKSKNIDFAYVSMGGLDSLMHSVGTQDEKVEKKVRWYDQRLRETLELAEQNYEDVKFHVFTDHGMHDTKSTYDLQAEIAKLDLIYNEDYVAVYDSTMARFWYLNQKGKETIQSFLQDSAHGRTLSDDELKDLGVYFEDRKFGEEIFMMNSGEQICPSYMGEKFTPGLHGYHPSDADSYAQICGNSEPRDDLKSIKDIYKVMMDQMHWLMK